MSLTVASQATQLGLLHVEQEIAVVSSNINNADNPGYTRKTLKTAYSTNGMVTVPVGGQVVQSVPDALLAKQVNTQSTASYYATTLSDYLSTYDQSLGSTSSDATTLSSSMDDLTSTLQILEASPSDSSARAKVVNTAQTLAAQFNSLSSSVQESRLQANNDIATSVDSINQSIQTIYNLNKQISLASNTGQSAADLEDQRNTAVQTLSQQMGVQYFVDNQNEMVVYSPSGTKLVSGAGYSTLNYNPVGVMTAAVSYPSGGISGITLSGTDITTSITSGKLGALIQLRDTTFPDEQDKLDNLASMLKSTVNNALNEGSAYPPLNTVTGVYSGLTSATALSATGTMRVAVTDQSGIVQSFADLNLSSYSTVGALVTAINGISGLSASLNANGQLSITATSSTNGISINPMDSNVSGNSISTYFGFNNLFVNGTNSLSSASDLQVRSSVLSNSNSLVTGAMSSSGTLAVGDRGLTSGDGSIITSLVDTLGTAQNFAAAGNFGSRAATLSTYAGSIISDVATQASAAQANSDTASATLNYLSSNYSNETGVNVNEETANLTTLQTYYQANAQLLSTIKSLFATLIAAVQ
jgi:flagellar hook-associated protein 1 FlgK